jgi:hypothetical protein
MTSKPLDDPEGKQMSRDEELASAFEAASKVLAAEIPITTKQFIEGNRSGFRSEPNLSSELGVASRALFAIAKVYSEQAKLSSKLKAEPKNDLDKPTDSGNHVFYSCTSGIWLTPEKPLNDFEIGKKLLAPFWDAVEHSSASSAYASLVAEARKQLRVTELREALKVTLHMAEHMRGDLRVKYQKLLAETEPTP